MNPNEATKSLYSTSVEAVKAFIQQRLADTTDTKGAFTSDQLRNFVQNNVAGRISPSTTDRALRNLRALNEINYIVLNRGKSLYRAVPVVATTTAPSITSTVTVPGSISTVNG